MKIGNPRPATATAHDRSAFSLIELTVVLLILAIASAAVTLKIQRPLRTARIRDLTDAISHFDRLTRVAAKEQERSLVIVVDMSKGELHRTDDRARPLESIPLRVPEGLTIERVLIRSEEMVRGKAFIPVSRRGLTPSYALLVVGGGQKQWVLIAGLTGEPAEVRNEKQVREILAAVGVGRDAG